MCYVPTQSTSRNYTITDCRAGYCTKYTRYHVGLLRYIRSHDVVQRYIRYKPRVTYRRTVQREIKPLRTARRGITQNTHDTTSDYSGTYDVIPRYIRYKRCVTYRHTIHREITPLRTARRGITRRTRGTTSDY